jgi:hypothetical protein
MLDSLQPTNVEQRLESAGFPGIEIQYGTVLDEWFIVFRTLEVYRSFLTSIIGSPMYNVMDEGNCHIYTKQMVEPLEFGVIVYVHEHKLWEDWQTFFQSLFTFMRV